ncbi:MAG: CAP domain-containing protein [Chloroflexi bacterium]|nr:CAP domain-containing protein [Chloroflexota bacterium]
MTKGKRYLLMGSYLLLLLGITAVLFAQTDIPPIISSTHSLPGETSTALPISQEHMGAVGTETLYLPLIFKSNSLHPFEQDVLDLVNQERATAGCAPLTANDQLVTAARDHSDDMAVNDFFSHTGSDNSSPGDRIDRQGYRWSRWGENIAAGYSSPASVMNGWMNSPGHRANILNCSYTEIGIGYTYLANDAGSVNYRHYWTQDFATPR